MEKNELFSIPESLSPKVKWMRENGIQTYFSKGLTEEEEPWCAFKGTMEDVSRRCVAMEENGEFVTGNDEEECLWRLCENLKIPFYK